MKKYWRTTRSQKSQSKLIKAVARKNSPFQNRKVSGAVNKGKRQKKTKQSKNRPKKKKIKTDQKQIKTALFMANNHQEKFIFQIVTSHKKVLSPNT